MTLEITTETIINSEPITFPREYRGSIDLGVSVTSCNTRTGATCLNCQKQSLLETVSSLSCTSCKSVYEDYWPGATTRQSTSNQTI